MAHTQNTNLFFNFTSAIFSAVETVANAVGGFVESLFLARSRANLFQTLNAMSDAELHARHGLDRGDVVNFVFATEK
jgi:hypothetical protein